MLKYKPIAEDGRWHVAYLVPGTDDLWSSITDCPTYAMAMAECRRLIGEAITVRRELAQDQRLRLRGVYAPKPVRISL